MLFRRRDRRNKREAARTEHHGVVRAVALLAAGLGIGSGLALLMAPNSGEEVRYAIGRRYLKTMKRLGRRREVLRDILGGLLEHGSDVRSSRLRRFLMRRAIRRAIEERLRAA